MRPMSEMSRASAVTSMPLAILLRAVINSVSGCVRTRRPNSCGVACPSHPREIAFEVTGRLGHVPIPAFGLGGHPHPAKIVVPVAIAEPPTHLEQRIVRASIPKEVARRKTLKR